MMLTLVVGMLAVTAYVNAGGQQRSDNFSPNKRRLIEDVVIVSPDSGPVQNVLLQGPYKLVPVQNAGYTSRVIRRDDDNVPGKIARQLRLRGPARRQRYLRRSSTRANAQMPPTGIRRGDKIMRSNISSDRYVQTVDSPEGPVAIPVAQPQKSIDDKSAVAEISDVADYYGSFPINSSDFNLEYVTPGLPLKTKVIKTVAFPQRPDFQEVVYSPNPKSPLPPPVETSVPQPYGFLYGMDDGLGSSQYRQESGNGDGVVTGNYGYKDFKGLYRRVNYVADKDGFRAVVRSNEPGVLPIGSADAPVVKDPPPPEVVIPVKGYSV